MLTFLPHENEDPFLVHKFIYIPLLILYLGAGVMFALSNGLLRMAFPKVDFLREEYDEEFRDC